MKPDFNDTEVRALFAVMRGARNVRTVADEIGRSVFTAHRSLTKLGEAGLVNFGSGTRNTTVATCRVVGVEESKRSHPSTRPDPAA